MNPTQRKFAADSFKELATAQLAGVGIKEISESGSGSVSVGLMLASIVAWFFLVTLGLDFLKHEDGG